MTKRLYNTRGLKKLPANFGHLAQVYILDPPGGFENNLQQARQLFLSIYTINVVK